MQNFPINLMNSTGGQTATLKPQNALGDGGTNKNFNGGCLSYNYIMPVRYCELKGERRVYFLAISPVSAAQAELLPLILSSVRRSVFGVSYICNIYALHTSTPFHPRARAWARICACTRRVGMCECALANWGWWWCMLAAIRVWVCLYVCWCASVWLE